LIQRPDYSPRCSPSFHMPIPFLYHEPEPIESHLSEKNEMGYTDNDRSILDDWAQCQMGIHILFLENTPSRIGTCPANFTTSPTPRRKKKRQTDRRIDGTSRTVVFRTVPHDTEPNGTPPKEYWTWHSAPRYVCHARPPEGTRTPRHESQGFFF
jgi:hypothetical protein